MYHIGLNGFFNPLLRKKCHVLLAVLVALAFLPEAFCQEQQINPVAAIRELKEGYLLVRLPSFRAKTDTLSNMISRSKDQATVLRLQKLLEETEQERDTLHAQYKKAFKQYYTFSRVAWFHDYESRDLSNAKFYSMDDVPVPWDLISAGPYFLLHFERTNESKIESLAIYHSSGEKPDAPFPNNFTRGGFNFLFVSLSEKPFADWRIEKINKRLHRFWSDVN